MLRSKTDQAELRKILFGGPDYDTALSIRKEVFVEEQGVTIFEEVDQYERTATHYLLYLEGVTVGAARWRKTESGHKIERMAVLQLYRNQHLGAVMLEGMLDDIEISHTEASGKSPLCMYLHAQESVISFYLRAGFQIQGERFYECDIPHFYMFKV